MRLVSCWLLLILGVAVAVPQVAVPTPDQVRANFRRLLDRPRVPLDPQSTSETEGELQIERGTFASEATERVPFLIIRPRTAPGKLPAVIVLHGTGGNKEGQAPLLKELARRGFLALASDGRHHGARVAGGAKGSTAYQEAITRAWREPGPKPSHYPFYFDTVWDLWRTVDYLLTRADVDATRLGVIGFSKGGIEAWLGASVDERIKVTVPAIAVQSFRWSLENDQWQGRAKSIGQSHEAARADLGEPAVNQRVCRELWNKVVPGILDQFDCPSMIRLFAPRPLLVLSGEKDPNCPLEGAKLAVAQAERSYDRAHARDRFQVDLAAGVAHQVTPEQRALALAWFERWLKQ